VLLDLYGTDHDPAHWRDPGSFDPHRFLGVEPDTYTLIPQGGGEPTGHRCPGERTTIEVLKTTAHLLSCLDYDVPPQRLAYRLGRMPTRPASGFVISGIRRR
jgi:fatty-acid peroxygenase